MGVWSIYCKINKSVYMFNFRTFSCMVPAQGYRFFSRLNLESMT